jgi:pyrroloquinoline quinone biosynthesis protein B
MLRAIILGAGAGGGFPQWNSNAPACRRARAGDPAAPARTQTSVAVSADGTDWFLLNASPDLRIQIERTPVLHPRGDALRTTPIAGVVLAGGEVDAIAGLLTLREGQAFRLWATPGVLARLDANPIFEVVSRALVPRLPLVPGMAQRLSAPDRPALFATAIPVAGKVPLYAENDRAPDADADDTVALLIETDTARLLFVPACAAVTPTLATLATSVDCVLFDGTLWRDDEMIRAGLGPKTGARMGHVSAGGPDGVLAQLRHARAPRKVLIHMNNSNPALLADSPERAELAAAGWDAAHDGMEIML